MGAQESVKMKLGLPEHCGASLSIKYKLENEKNYLDEISEYNIKKSTYNFLTPKSKQSFISNIGNNSSIKKRKSKIKKYNLNILYYDEHLKNNEENSDNCSFFEMNINGTFYGCHNFELFKTVCGKLINSKKEFILLSSGSCAQKIFDYCSNVKEIREYYIYCFLKGKYLPLMNKYPKLKGVYNIFSELKSKLYTIKEIQMNNISSSNLIFFEDYIRIYIKLHYEFIRKYSLYKLLKSKNCNESQFLYLVKKKYPHFLPLARQLFPDKQETIDFFVKNAYESESTVRKFIECDENILDDNIQSYIKNYTKQSFYYKYLNKFLREGKFDAFRTLSSHIAKFIFKLYDYREKNIHNQKTSNLYRRMCINKNDIKLYEQSVDRVICYPSFTSTSIGKNKFMLSEPDSESNIILLIIEQNNTKSVVSIRDFSAFQNNTKSVVSIRDFSAFKGEEEYLFLPFSFFKITKVELKQGSAKDPHIVHMIALNSDTPVEDMFYNFIQNETDNLNPEGLDFLLLTNNKTKIIFNDIYLTKNKY